MTYQPAVYRKLGGDELVVASSGTLTVESGGKIDLQSGSTLTIAGNVSVTGTLTISSGGLLIDEDGKWDDLRFPSASVRVPGSGGPGMANTFGTIQTLAFDAASKEVIYLQAQMPHHWKKSTNIVPHVHFCTTATTPTGAVVWGLQYTVADIGGSFAAATTSVKTASATTAHGLVSFDEIDMSTYTGPSTMILIQLYRDSTAAEDTCTTDAHLLEFDIHYKINSLGSSGATSVGP